MSFVGKNAALYRAGLILADICPERLNDAVFPQEYLAHPFPRDAEGQAQLGRGLAFLVSLKKVGAKNVCWHNGVEPIQKVRA